MELTIDQIFEQALNAHKEGRLQDAERLYHEVLKINSSFAEAYYNLAIAQNELKKEDEALINYKKSIKLKPEFPEAYSNLGALLYKLGRLNEAEISIKKAIELKPDYAEAYNNLGNTLIDFGKLNESEKNCKKAIELKPDFAEAYYNLGVVQEKLNKPDEALINSKKAIELKPNFAEAYCNLALIQNQLENFDEAEVNYKKAIELKPDYIDAHNNLGNILKELGRLDEAMSSYTQAIALKPDCETSLFQRGKILFKNGEFELALKDFDCSNDGGSRLQALITLYALERIEEIYIRINTHLEVDSENIGIAAFSSFISHKKKRNTGHNFCSNPIDFLYYSNLTLHIKDPTLFIDGIIEDLHKEIVQWNPSSTSTNKGFQGRYNLFADSSKKIKNLESIILHELDLYYQKFKNETCAYIQKWPTQKQLRGWHIILKQHGHQTSHIHTGGWLSGVIYLKIVPSLGRDEGAIEFSLNGENYYDVDSPNVMHSPKVGDIIFFPSSLNHRTLPFTTDSDRITVSFDLVPNSDDKT